MSGALERARRRAHGPEGYADQHGFASAPEILGLARAAGVGPGVSVLDVCCGPGGPGVLVATTLGGGGVAGPPGVDYLGVDADPLAIETARRRGAPGCRFEVRRVPPLPRGPFDVVLLLETMLAFRDKATLLSGVHDALAPGGRFAFTVEEGEPLTHAERAVMPAPDTVWPVPLEELLGLLQDAGLEVVSHEERSASHLAVVDALVACFRADAEAIAAEIGAAALESLLVSHGHWGEWLRSGRIRKFDLVAQRSVER